MPRNLVRSLSGRWPIRTAAVCALLCSSIAAQQVSLDSNTLADYRQYVAKVESAIEARQSVNGLVWTQDENAPARLKQGEVVANPAAADGDVEVRGGVIHDWAGAVFIPGANLAKAVSLLRDYPNYGAYYAPDIASASVLDGSGDEVKVRMRLLKKVLITLVFEGDFEARFRRVNARRWLGSATSFRFVEIDKPGTPQEKALPEGTGSGMLWRVANYFALTEADGGVYLEMRSLSLSNPLPAAMSFARPVIVRIPRQSLAATLEATRKHLNHE